MSKGGIPARLAAAQVLTCVLSERRTLDDALVKTDAFEVLEGSDRGFARAMVSAALRELGRINLVLAPLLSRPLEKVDPVVRSFLQIGAAQILILKTPPHAAVGATVDAAKQVPTARKASGLINAVLRKVSSVQADFDGLDVKAIWPKWLLDALQADFDDAVVACLASQQISPPDLHLTAKSGDAATLAEHVGGQALSPGSVCVAGARSVPDLPGYTEGAWWVQDAAAALPARLLSRSNGANTVDLCAAPGGKTLQLASFGLSVIAIDRSKARLQRVKENLERTGLAGKVTLVASKGEDWQPDRPVDSVLVDAPCSALGTLRRHPEGAWIKRPDEIARYPDIQKRLLRAAIALLQPGGKLVYCVCSPLKAEGIKVVEAVLSDGGCTRDLIRGDEVPGFSHAITEDGDLLTLPGSGFAHDAFFIARLVKTG